jgi:hypothetical protein
MWNKTNKGKIKRPGRGESVDVTYFIKEFGPDEFIGRINLGDDRTDPTTFGEQFKGDQPDDQNGPGEIWILKTAAGLEVSIRFTRRAGTFRCLNSSEAKGAIAEYAAMLQSHPG